jgi:hypothetical protein
MRADQNIAAIHAGSKATHTTHLGARFQDRRSNMMDWVRPHRLLWLLLLLLVVVALALCVVPVGPTQALYEGVGRARGQEIVCESRGVPYVLEDGRLFLLRQEIRSSLLLMTWVSRTEWTERKLKELRVKYPELNDVLLWD